MMVGDGFNDAPSLARGSTMGAGTDFVAIDSADVILVKNNPSDILHLLNLAKNTWRKMVQSLWWGAGYNFYCDSVGAVFMSISTVIVAINAMMLKLE